MVGDDSSLSLFLIFFDTLDTEIIYDIGWRAADSWLYIVTPLLLTIAIWIRVSEEKYSLISGENSSMRKVWVAGITAGLAIGIYFGLAEITIRFFPALWNLTTQNSLTVLGDELERLMNALWEKDYKFSLSEIGDSLMAVFALGVYWLTHVALVAITFFLKIGHAVLLSFTLFWGAVAIPMSVTRGLKMLTAFRTMSIFVCIWPIVESFFSFMITNVFLETLKSPVLDVEKFKSLTMGKVMFYHMVFSTMQILLAASIIAAPILANSIAMGSGSALGVVGSFAAAGVASATKAFKMAEAGGAKGLSQAGNLASKGLAAANQNKLMGASVGSLASSAAKSAMGSLRSTPEAKPQGYGFASKPPTVNSSGGAGNSANKPSSASSSSPSNDGSENSAISTKSGGKSSSASKMMKSSLASSLQGADETKSEAKPPENDKPKTKKKKTAAEKRRGIFMGKAKSNKGTNS